MYFNKPLVRFLTILLVFIFAFTSCAQDKLFVPGKSSIDDNAINEQGYMIAELDPKVLPDKSVELTHLSTEINSDIEGESIQYDYLSASGFADSNGVIAFFDPEKGISVPVVLLDANNQPISGLQVKYLKNENNIIIAINDPLNRFAPKWITLHEDEIIKGISLLDSIADNNIDADLRVTEARAVGLILAIVVFLIAYGFIVKTGIEINTNPEKVYEVSGYDKYICKSPELLGAEATALSSLIFVIVPIPGGEEIKQVGEVGKAFVAEVIGYRVATSADSPILFHEYFVDKETLEMIASGEGIDLDTNQRKAARIYEKVGECAYVPNVVNMNFNEAKQKIAQSKLKFNIEYFDTDGKPVSADSLTANSEEIVISQEPEPIYINPDESFDNQLKTMLPIGDFPGLSNEIALTVKVIPADENKVETRPIGTTASLKVVAERRGESTSEFNADAVYTVHYKVTKIYGSILTIYVSSDDAPTDSFPYWTNEVFDFDVLEKRKLNERFGWEYTLISEFENTLTYTSSQDWINEKGFRYVCSGTTTRDALSGMMLSDYYVCDIYDPGEKYWGKDKFIKTLIDLQEP